MSAQLLDHVPARLLFVDWYLEHPRRVQAARDLDWAKRAQRKHPSPAARLAVNVARVRLRAVERDLRVRWVEG
jgi:hypothetical protein